MSRDRAGAFKVCNLGTEFCQGGSYDLSSLLVEIQVFSHVAKFQIEYTTEHEVFQIERTEIVLQNRYRFE